MTRIDPRTFLRFLWSGWALLWLLGAVWSARTVARESAASRVAYSAVTVRERHGLVLAGPYAVTRHPIYTGLLCAMVGTALTLDRLAGVAGFALVTAGVVAKVRLEERLLLSHFGDAYQAYRAEVPALIPRPW